MHDGGFVILPTEVGVAEERARAFVIGERGYERSVMSEHSGGIALGSGVESENDVALALADFRGESYGVRDGVKEVFRGAGRVGESNVGEREIRIEFGGLLKLSV